MHVSGPYIQNAHPYGKTLWQWQLYYVQSNIERDKEKYGIGIAIAGCKIEVWRNDNVTLQRFGDSCTYKRFKSLSKAMKCAVRLIAVAERDYLKNNLQNT